MSLLEQLAEIRQALVSYRRQPEFWIIVGGILFILTTSILGKVASIVFAPTAAERVILSSGGFKVFKVAQVNIPCRLDGIKPYGYKFLAGSEDSLGKLAEGVACWDLSKRRWEWAFNNPAFAKFNSNPLRP